MKRPAFQFYPADWRSNANLRRCTHAERGIWIEVMCLLHDAEEYGVLRWPLAEIAQAVGCKAAELRSLVSKGVLKGADVGATCEAFVFVPRSGGRDGEPVVLVPGQAGPVWYSSRMVRDEYVRVRRGASTQFGGDHEPPPKSPPKAAPKPPPKGGFGVDKGDGPSSSSSSSMLASLAPRASEREPEPPRELEPAVALAVEARRHGIACNGADPRLRKLADEGVTPETLRAACEEAKRRKGAGVGIGYVAAVVTGWAEDAARIAVPQGAGAAEWKGAL